METDEDPKRWNKYVTAWTVFGSHEAENHERGVVCSDLHRDNIIYGTGHDNKLKVTIVDLGGWQSIHFPEDWRLLPVALLSLFTWLEDDLAAAFRFGYLHQGGPIATMIFDELRNTYDLNSFREFADIAYESHKIIEEKLLEDQISTLNENRDWQELRKDLPLGDITERPLEVGDLDLWRAHRDTERTQNLRADEYHYNKHLIASMAEGSLYHMLEAILNLHGLYYVQRRLIKALGFALYSERITEKFASRVSDETMRQVAAMNHRTYSEANKGIEHGLRRLPEIGNVFHWLWCVDDFEKGIVTVKL